MARPRKNLYEIPTPLQVVELRNQQTCELLSELIRAVEKKILEEWVVGVAIAVPADQGALVALDKLTPNWWEEILRPYFREKQWEVSFSPTAAAFFVMDRESFLAIPQAAEPEAHTSESEKEVAS